MPTTTDTVPELGSIEPNRHGYKDFALGKFSFSRDEYFAHVRWPNGTHMLAADAFLRAIQRDVAWGFFYGIVNFDTVIGTVQLAVSAGRPRLLGELQERRDQPALRGDPDRLDEHHVRPLRVSGGDRQRLRTQERIQQAGGYPAPGHRQADDRGAGGRAGAHRRERLPGQPPLHRRAAGRAGGARGARLRGPGGLGEPLRLPLALGRDLEPVGGVGVYVFQLLRDHRGV